MCGSNTRRIHGHRRIRFEDLRAAIGRLRQKIPIFSYEMETSAALGFGFRCGFLGLLHLEIIEERLSREFDLDLIATAPGVRLQGEDAPDGWRSSPTRPTCPTRAKIDSISELWISAIILTPTSTCAPAIKLCQDCRGSQRELTAVGPRAMVVYDLPLNEVVFDFDHRLNPISQGLRLLRLPDRGLPTSDLVKTSILVNAEPVDALSMPGPPRPGRGPRPRHASRR